MQCSPRYTGSAVAADYGHLAAALKTRPSRRDVLSAENETGGQSGGGTVRVLYVARPVPREKLILTAVLEKAEGKMGKLSQGYRTGEADLSGFL